MGGVVQSHFIIKPNLVLRLGWGFDNKETKRDTKGEIQGITKYTNSTSLKIKITIRVSML